MPSDRDLEKIERMVEELGEKEREESLKGSVAESGEAVAETEEIGLEEDLTSLLEDIQLGIEEEKKLEGMKEPSIEESSIEVASTEEPSTAEEEGPVESEEHFEKRERIEEELPEEATEETPTDKMDEKKPQKREEISKSEVESEEIEKLAEEELAEIEGLEEEEYGEEEGLDLPEDFDLEKAEHVEEPPNGFFKAKAEKAGEVSAEEKLAGELGEIMEGVEVEEEAEIPEGEIEPFEEEIPGVEATSEEPSLEELTREGELKKEEKLEEELKKEGLAGEGEVEEELPDFESLLEEEAGESVEEKPPEESFEEQPELEEVVAGKEAEGEDEIEEEAAGVEEELSGLEEKPEEVLSEEAGEETPPEEEVEREAEEEKEEVEELENIEIPDIEELEKEALGEAAEEIEPEGGEFPAEKEEVEAGPPEAGEEKPTIDIELSDEDIILITTKLKQLNPALAKAIRDSIVNLELPTEQLKGILTLLMRDAPEEEIRTYYEAVTGKRIAVEKLPEVIRVEKKPGVLATVYENLGPLVRVGALGVITTALLFAVFMFFFYKPIKSTKYYNAGRRYIKTEEYDLAEYNFKKAVKIYEKIKEYDRYGWEYMLAGNYEAARQKLEAGVSKDKKFRYIDLRLHLAKLYNVTGKYEKADKLYDQLIKIKPKKYEFVKLKGLNLIDWSRVNREKLKEALALFSSASEKFPKKSDPLIRMLYIEILRNNEKSVNELYKYLNQNFSGEYDPMVHARLAEYFVSKHKYYEAKSLLMKLVGKFPDFPLIYYVYAMYYKAINSKEDEEFMLNMAITKEKSRKLVYPWDSRNRVLLSNAYNELGEIYAGLELPGKSAEAIRYFKMAIEENPKNKKAYFNLAQVYFYKEKDYELAELYYKKAMEMGFINDDLIYNLGVLYFYRRDFEDAEKNWMKLSQKYPGNPNISFALSCALLYMKKYQMALGELLNLADIYDGLVKDLGEIKPWLSYHRRIVLEASAVYNNLGVAYQKLYELEKRPEYQKKALISLYKAGELADIIGVDWGKIQYNLNYILHPNVIRADMAISDTISDNFRFIKR